jgi:hypothetical protein
MTARGAFANNVTAPHKTLSTYVCKSLFKRKNSQILRRPQDDIQFGGSFANAPRGCHHMFAEKPPPVAVILSAAKDLVFLPAVMVV